MICQNCKAQLAAGQKFCPKCGTKAAAQPVPGPLSPSPGAASDALPLPPVPESRQALPPVPESSPARAPVSATSAASPTQGGEVVCPKCGTRNAANARFCKKDGAPLHGSSPAAAAATPRTPPRPPWWRRLSPRSIAIAGGVLILAMVAFVSGLLYWTGYIGDRQSTIAQEINSDLGGKGLGNVRVVVDQQWRATAEGLVGNATEKDQALAVIRAHGKFKEPLVDLIRVRPTRAELQAILNKVAADTGIPQASAQIDEGLTKITVGGVDLGPEARAKMEQALTSALSSAGASAQVQFVYPAATAPAIPAPTGGATPAADGETARRALNEQLRAAALSGVSADFDGAGRVRLQGTVSSQAQHDRAVQIAASQAGVSGVIDLLQVTVPAPSVAPSRDPARLEGEINRALRSNGLGGITALVADDFSVTLKGSTNSNGNKLRAFQLLRQFPIRGAPKDRVFVVE